MGETVSMEQKQQYVQTMHDLTYKLMIIIFVKKNGEERVMLATRSRDIYRMEYGDAYNAMNGMDNKCSIQNGNIACIDMVIGEARMFNRFRVLQQYILGEPKNNAEYAAMFDKFMEFKNKYKPVTQNPADMDVKAEVTGSNSATADMVNTEQAVTSTAIEDMFNIGNTASVTEPIMTQHEEVQNNGFTAPEIPQVNISQSAFSQAFELGGSGQ